MKATFLLGNRSSAGSWVDMDLVGKEVLATLFLCSRFCFPFLVWEIWPCISWQNLGKQALTFWNSLLFYPKPIINRLHSLLCVWGGIYVFVCV